MINTIFGPAAPVGSKVKSGTINTVFGPATPVGSKDKIHNNNENNYQNH